MISADDRYLFVVRTVGDTHDRTAKLLADNNNFGMADGQVTLMRQEKVPCFSVRKVWGGVEEGSGGGSTYEYNSYTSLYRYGREQRLLTELRRATQVTTACSCRVC